MSNLKLMFLIHLFFPFCNLFAQADSGLISLQQIPDKYFKDTEKKIDNYTHRISSKTKKTLIKLARWETKIQRLMQKANPEVAAKLFNPEQLSFRKMLDNYQKGEETLVRNMRQYDQYTDELLTQIKFLQTKTDQVDEGRKQVIGEVEESALLLEKEELRSQTLQKAINERKKQLISEAVNHLKNTKYLQKINKENYYYIETLKNYKSLLTDETKREELLKKTLFGIPAFKKFMNDNSRWGSIFGVSSANTIAQNLPGLQTRASLTSQLQDRLGSNGPNAIQNFQQVLQKGQNELNALKNRLTGVLQPAKEEGLPDFKPNNQKTKTFAQRLEYGFNIQFEKKINFYPSSTSIAFTIGYKLSDKFSTGLGLSGKIGLGQGLDKLKFTAEGLGLRSYLDWKYKKKLFLTTGYEQNLNRSIKNFSTLGKASLWNQSALIGLSKQVQGPGKRKGKIQVLYDLFASKNIPATNPIKIRTCINLK